MLVLKYNFSNSDNLNIHLYYSNVQHVLVNNATACLHFAYICICLFTYVDDKADELPSTEKDDTFNEETDELPTKEKDDTFNDEADELPTQEKDDTFNDEEDEPPTSTSNESADENEFLVSDNLEARSDLSQEEVTEIEQVDSAPQASVEIFDLDASEKRLLLANAGMSFLKELRETHNIVSFSVADSLEVKYNKRKIPNIDVVLDPIRIFLLKNTVYHEMVSFEEGEIQYIQEHRKEDINDRDLHVSVDLSLVMITGTKAQILSTKKFLQKMMFGLVKQRTHLLGDWEFFGKDNNATLKTIQKETKCIVRIVGFEERTDAATTDREVELLIIADTEENIQIAVGEIKTRVWYYSYALCNFQRHQMFMISIVLCFT